MAYLQHLTDMADLMKRRHPALIPTGLYHTVWPYMTSDLASKRIDYYNQILNNAYSKLYRR